MSDEALRDLRAMEENLQKGAETIKAFYTPEQGAGMVDDLQIRLFRMELAYLLAEQAGMDMVRPGQLKVAAAAGQS